MLTGEVFSVLSQISTRGAFFGLGADNFVRTCVVRNGIGRHGSYMIGDYTSLIVTFLIATVFPVLLAALAQNLERPVAGCRRCKRDAGTPGAECCLQCGAIGMNIDYRAGGERAKKFMTRRVKPAAIQHGVRPLNIDSDVLANTPANLTHTAAMAAKSIAKSTFALLEIESAYIDR